jgi:hypothetical protein
MNRKTTGLLNLSPSEERLLRANDKLSFQLEPEEIQYMHSCFCQIGLPRTKPRGRTYEHTVHNYSLSLQAGRLFNGKSWTDVDLPYGVTPRLILIYITTYAKRHKTRVVHVGNNMSEFLKNIGIIASGGERGGITNFKKQAKALSVCQIQIGFKDENGRPSTVNGHFVEKSSWDKFDEKKSSGDKPSIEKPAWDEFNLWVPEQENQLTLWESEIHLSPQFYNSILDHSVPLDYSALSSVHHNALALDLYSFLVHRLPRVKKPVFLNWEMLRQQFCPNYRDSSSGGFRSKFNTAMTKALLVYPNAKVEKTKHGYLLKSSQRAVPQRFLNH